MIAKEQLHAVETAIRKAIPRLLEPTEGCKLNFKKKYFLESVEGQVIKNYNKYVLVYSKEYDDTFLRAIEHCEIFGHDILLSDVLEWLKTISIGSGIDTEKLHKILYYWDLSKPRLTDQSEELINFLYNLINLIKNN